MGDFNAHQLGKFQFKWLPFGLLNSGVLFRTIGTTGFFFSICDRCIRRGRVFGVIFLEKKPVLYTSIYGMLTALLHMMVLTLFVPGGGKIYHPLDLFVDNFFIVGRIDLKFSVNSYN